MFVVALHGKKVKRLVLWSVVVVFLHLLALRYLTADDIDSVSLAALQGRRVMIDAGHGGIDSGAAANDAIEKEITLAVALKLAKILETDGAVVFLTRDSDVDYYTRGKGGKRRDLLKRIEMIDGSGAELFVSIHCNAIRGVDGMLGAQVFYYGSHAENKLLAEVLQRALREFPPGNKRQAKEDSHILLLNATKTPGVLIETGYLTNKSEALLLRDERYQALLAGQIAKGLAYHFSRNEVR